MGEFDNVIAAYSEDQTERLTGVSKTQLRYWDKINFYSPSYAEESRRMAFSRVYSFKDLVALRVLNVLRNQYRISLHHLRDVSDNLVGFSIDPDKWLNYNLYVVNKRVIWHEPGTNLPQDIVTKQYVVPTISLEAVISDTKRDVAKTRSKRDSSKIGVITRSRFINHNLPVIAGTRIPVRAIKRFSAAGYCVDEIIAEYPDLKPDDIKAALDFSEASSAA